MNESQIRQIKALGLAIILLPSEFLLAYFFGYFIGFGFLFGVPAMIGTVIFLIGYAMVPSSPPKEAN